MGSVASAWELACIRGMLQRRPLLSGGCGHGRKARYMIANPGMQSMEGKHIFELPLTEIGDVQGTKEDVILEFHIDDGTISQKEDGLCSITFVVPDDNQHFPGKLCCDSQWHISYCLSSLSPKGVCVQRKMVGQERKYSRKQLWARLMPLLGREMLLLSLSMLHASFRVAATIYPFSQALWLWMAKTRNSGFGMFPSQTCIGSRLTCVSCKSPIKSTSLTATQIGPVYTFVPLIHGELVQDGCLVVQVLEYRSHIPVASPTASWQPGVGALRKRHQAWTDIL